MGPLQWGDVPTAVGVAFAGAAAWFGYQTIKSQRQQIGEQREFIGEQMRFMDDQRQNLVLERAELSDAAEDRKWAHARRVRMDHRVIPVGTEGAGRWGVEVRNDSLSSITDLEVRFGTAYFAAEVYQSLGSNALGERWISPLPVLGSWRAAEFRSQAWPEATVHNNRPTLYFTDDTGGRWSLDSYGKLEEAPAGGAS
ncbi:hypothetical protein ABZY09_44625 [Streptomyces sp. NPDC002928]|uniref:hypothetical protein n=1 Tax=Streptomyces sp. NPDC002928 TaxID=3154440 RepID=UPI0033A676BB